jgi:hypothetical protein
VPLSTGPDDPAAAGRGHLRASHADREHVIAVLKTAFVQDRLTKDDFDHLVGQVLASRTYAELAALTAEIPTESATAVPPAQPGSRTLAIAARRSGVCALITVALVEGAALGDSFALLCLAVFSFIATVAFLGYGFIDAREERRPRAQLPPAQAPSHDGLNGGQPGPSAPGLSSPGTRTDPTRTDPTRTDPTRTDSTRTDLRTRRWAPIRPFCTPS